jgi:hypothetical protein
MKYLMLVIVAALALASPAIAGQHCSTWCDANGSGRCETNCN